LTNNNWNYVNLVVWLVFCFIKVAQNQVEGRDEVKNLILPLVILVMLASNALSEGFKGKSPDNKTHTIYNRYGVQQGFYKRDNQGNIQFQNRYGVQEGSMTKDGRILNRYGVQEGSVK
jgi:hypothetical protein